MAGSLSLDDQLLGEKMHYYCSSSDEEYESCDDGMEHGNLSKGQSNYSRHTDDFSGAASNTGPKGVINDWRRYKQLEAEKREVQEQELVALQKKLSLTCRSHLDDDKENKEDENLLEELEMVDDEFMKEYRKKRLEEMRKLLRDVPHYDAVHELKSADEYLSVTENCHQLTTIVIHVYEGNVDACTSMNGCLQALCKEYPTVRFCRILARNALLSTKFCEDGVPALLVYRKGELVGNLVALQDQLGNDFFADEVEKLLLSHGLLPPKTVPEQIVAAL